MFGIDVLKREKFASLDGKRVGLLTNPSGVDNQLRSTWSILWNAPNVNLVALFAPEHGFTATAADGVHINTAVDSTTGLPVYSLYGKSMRPTPDMLKDLDVIVYDIQDVGVRYYTYMWTLTHVLEAAGENDVEVMVLDRPNPLGGLTVSGTPLEPEFTSLVGRFPVPIIHGMTTGELAQTVNTLWNPIPAQIRVIPCKGWSRHMTWDKTGLVWVPTSPAIAHLSTLAHYPGACLIEGTNLSEGRGTTLPFEIVGAPFINADRLADHLNALKLPGIYFRPHIFTPTASKWAKEICFGVQAHIVDHSVWQPLLTWLCVIREIRLLYPEQFKWIPPYEDRYHFDLLIGTDRIRQQIEAGTSIKEMTERWDEYCDFFRQQHEPFLIYK